MINQCLYERSMLSGTDNSLVENFDNSLTVLFLIVKNSR